jgi:hypothetical protein
MNKKIIVLFFVLLIISNLFAEEIITRNDGSKIILYDDHTWGEVADSTLSLEEIVNKNRANLRNGVSSSEAEILAACEMYEQGWTYTMPRPKSSKAAWGVSDGRTTWFNGWWYNSKTKKYSDTTPKKSSSGLYLGDKQNSSNTWSNGGSPGRPDVFMFLLSGSGGPRG